MGKLGEFLKNKEQLKFGIMSYEDFEIDLMHFSNEYYTKHWELFRRKKDKERISENEFRKRLYNYLWVLKISELIIILYLEDLKGNHPTIYELNKLLKRMPNQYSATFKEIKNLEKLEIVYTQNVPNSARKQKQIYIKKNTVIIYGDDEFRQMMLDEWNTDAKEYIEEKLDNLNKEKTKFEKKIMMIKKGRRTKDEKSIPKS